MQILTIRQIVWFYVKTILLINTETQCRNCRNSLSHFFHENFVKAMDLLKKLLNRYIVDLTKFFFGERIYRFSTLCSAERWKKFGKLMNLLQTEPYCIVTTFKKYFSRGANLSLCVTVCGGCATFPLLIIILIATISWD